VSVGVGEKRESGKRCRWVMVMMVMMMKKKDDEGGGEEEKKEVSALQGEAGGWQS